MKDAMKKAAAQFGSILISAALAAMLAFVQSLVSAHGGQCIPPGDPATAAAFGGGLKVALYALQTQKLS